VTPSIGKIVHYVSYGTPGGEYKSECRAAIITEVAADPRESAGLCVLNPAGQFFNRAVPHDPGGDLLADADPAGLAQLCGGLWYAGGTWHWPARAD
jgi:hypothetical protein